MVCGFEASADYGVYSEDIKNPTRYTQGSLECWDFLLEHRYPCILDNAIKYVWRYQFKDGLKDLDKAIIYLEKAYMSAGILAKPAVPEVILGITSDYAYIHETLSYKGIEDDSRLDWMSEAQRSALVEIHKLLKPMDISHFEAQVLVAKSKVEALKASLT